MLHGHFGTHVCYESFLGHLLYVSKWATCIFCREFGVRECDYWWCEWPDSASKSIFPFRLLLDAFQVYRGWDLETSAAQTLPWLCWNRIYDYMILYVYIIYDITYVTLRSTVSGPIGATKTKWVFAESCLSGGLLVMFTVARGRYHLYSHCWRCQEAGLLLFSGCDTTQGWISWSQSWVECDCKVDKMRLTSINLKPLFNGIQCISRSSRTTFRCWDFRMSFLIAVIGPWSPELKCMAGWGGKVDIAWTLVRTPWPCW